jgi:Fe-S cluster assembly ATP-binding protein
MADLEIRDLHVQVEEKVILKGVNLAMSRGEIHAVMGPNGSGKSTLANVLMGNPFYQITKGEVVYQGEDLLAMAPDERARKGLFIAFQYPVSVPGVTMASFLRTAVSARRGYEHELMPVGEFQKLLMQKINALKIDPAIVGRYVNEGFSGGEKKRAEILQMALLEPAIAFMDETDSGLDIDSLRVVADGIMQMYRDAQGKMGVLVITHYARVLEFVKPDHVHIMYDGRIVVSGGPELAQELEAHGYEGIRRQFDVIAAEVQEAGAVRRAGKVFWVTH